MIDVWDSIEVSIAAYKDSTSRDLLQRFKEEYYLTLSAEADARRAKATAIIKSIAKLRIELKKFEYTYSLIKTKTGNINSVEKVITQIKHQIDIMIIEKNRFHV